MRFRIQIMFVFLKSFLMSHLDEMFYVVTFNSQKLENEEGHINDGFAVIMIAHSLSKLLCSELKKFFIFYSSTYKE